MEDVTQPVTPTSIPGSTVPAGPGAEMTGQTIGEFHIIRTLGHGGMGAVYLAEQQSLKRKVALKFLRPEMAANPIALSRFRREAEAVARLTHANIVQVYSIGEADGRQFMALEYVEGRNLKEYVNRKGALDVPVALTIMRQVAAALQRAAESNIVHRDIKPENILLTRKGEVKVADFGLSRDLAGPQDMNLTQEGVTMGTPLYMSPEQARGNPLDSRSDIYSFGVTCYHMLAGQPPFRGKTGVEVALKHVSDEPPSLAALRPDLPPALVALVHRMMSKEPADRPQSGREVLRELTQPPGQTAMENPFQGLGTPSSTASRPTDVEVRTENTAIATGRRSGWWFVAPLAVLLAAGVGIGMRLLYNANAAQSGREDHPNLPVVSERERQLLAAVELYAGNKTPNKVQQWAGNSVELGALYWEQKRYDDAERLFEQMARAPSAPSTYKSVPTLGLAVTFSLRDEVDRSNKLFLDAKTQAGANKPILPPGLMPTEDMINLRHWIVTALNRNLTRPPAVKEIEDLRNQFRRPNIPSGQGKAG
jgi:eukaryotic-like serine/threonine-protein kinase